MSTSATSNLAIIGGRLEDDNEAVFQKMKELSDGRIAVFSTASRVPIEVGEETVEVFKEYGFEVEHLPLFWENREKMAFASEIVDKLEDYGSVFFSGGDQSRIIHSLLQDGNETPVLQKLRELHRRGGLISGSSAGAAMMSTASIRGGVSLEAVVYGVADDPEDMGLLIGEGLGFFPWGLVDQHFLERGRFGRLIVAMFATGEPFGFGVDENTAMFVHDNMLHVLGESGVVMFDARDAFASNYGELGSDYCSLRMHFLDNGDHYDIQSHTLFPHESKKKVIPSQISYTTPGHINRSVFGANIFLELITRLAEGTDHYRYDKATAYEPEAELEVSLHLRRPKRSVSYSALLGESREYSMTGFELDLTCEAMSLQTRRIRQRERARYNAQRHIHGGEPLHPDARLIATGSGLLNDRSAELIQYLKEKQLSPIAIVAAASSEPRSATRDYIEMFARHGIEAKDLNIRESNTLYQSQNEKLFQEIVNSPAILFLGGAQERLVDTLLYRGENTRVLHAIIRAYRRGASLIAVSGAASALSEAMLAGGSTVEALQYGISADSWLRGVVLEPGFGFLRDAVVDQNILSKRRLGRLLVTCAEENERFGLGLLEHSGMSVAGEFESVEAIGAHGFLLLDLGSARVQCHRRQFQAERVSMRLVRPGQKVAIPSGKLLSQEGAKQAPKSTITLRTLLKGLSEDVALLNKGRAEVELCQVDIVDIDDDADTAVINIDMVRVNEGRRPVKELD